MKWIRAGKGIRYFEHESRRYGNRPDRYYSLFYKVNGKSYTEALGWESENRERGISMLQRAEEAMAEIRKNRRTGLGPVTKEERITQQKFQKEQEEKTRMEEAKMNISLNDFFENYFKPHAQRKLKFKSAQTELSHYYIWIKDKIGDYPILNIDSSSWDKIISGFNDKNLSDRTKIWFFAVLSG